MPKHGFNPTYDERIKHATPINSFIQALDLLTPITSGHTWLILNGAGIDKDVPPYIVHEHYFHRTGEFSSAELLKVTTEIGSELVMYTEGFPYLGGTDENIRSLTMAGQKKLNDELNKQRDDLREFLQPGTTPQHHGWSSCYKWTGWTNIARQTVATDAGDGYLRVISGAKFKNPLDESWVVLFDGRVLTPIEYKEEFGHLAEQFFEEHCSQTLMEATN